MVEGTNILRIDFDDPDGSVNEKLRPCRGRTGSAYSTIAASSSSIRSGPATERSAASASARPLGAAGQAPIAETDREERSAL
jgi:hypothetical protein